MSTDKSVAAIDRVSAFTLSCSASDIPSATLTQASLLLLDTLGICAASAPMDAGRIGRDLAVSLFGSAQSDMQARLLFDGRQASIAGAMFAAATQIDNLDGHDGYNPTKGHIGVVAAPALAVLAEAQPGLTGPDALAAMVIGYEVAGRAGMALHATVSDYHTSGAWNALGVVAMAARLRKHTPEQLRQGLGIAEYHGPRSQMMREISTPTMLHDGSGWGALAGISAAISAENGFTGAPAITVESEEAAPFWEDLGTFWQVDHQYIKPYPVCRWAHASIDAAGDICHSNEFNIDDISFIRIRSFNNAVELFGGIPATTSEAQYSLPFSVATKIAYDRIGLEHISGEGLRDPLVKSIVDKITMIKEPRHEVRYPLGRWADVEIELSDGRVLTSGDVHARGGPESPYSTEQTTDKFLEFATPVLGNTRATELLEAILALPNESSRFADVLDLLYDPV